MTNERRFSILLINFVTKTGTVLKYPFYHESIHSFYKAKYYEHSIKVSATFTSYSLLDKFFKTQGILFIRI